MKHVNSRVYAELCRSLCWQLINWSVGHTSAWINGSDASFLSVAVFFSEVVTHLVSLLACGHSFCHHEWDLYEKKLFSEILNY